MALAARSRRTSSTCNRPNSRFKLDIFQYPNIINVNGGAIALGHPIGASGTRIIVTLLHEMIKQDKKKGLASLCIGGGMGIATTWERK